MKSIIILATCGLSLFCFKNKQTTTYSDQTELSQSIERGKKVYQEFCVQCHLEQGEGQGKSIPPLRKSNWLTEKRNESIKTVKYGRKGLIIVNGKEYRGIMGNLGLYDDEVADVLNYVMNSFGNKQEKMVTETEVKSVQNNK